MLRSGDEGFARVCADEAVAANGLGGRGGLEEERRLRAGGRGDLEVDGRRREELGRDGGADGDERGRVLQDPGGGDDGVDLVQLGGD